MLTHLDLPYLISKYFFDFSGGTLANSSYPVCYFLMNTYVRAHVVTELEMFIIFFKK